MSIDATATQVVRIVAKQGKEIGLSVKGLTESAAGKSRLQAAFGLSRQVAQEVKLVSKQDSFAQVKQELFLLAEMGEKARKNILFRQWYRIKTLMSALFGKIQTVLKDAKQ